MKSTINITSGYYLNSYLQKKYPNETFIPFNEAMIEGNPTLPIFSESFIKERCQTNEVSEMDYRENMKEFMIFTNHLHDYSSITLWFGKDMFCQLNLLTILAYLHQENYLNSIYLNLIDDETYEIIEQITIPEEDYLLMYKKVFVDHTITNCQLSDLNQAIQEYFDYENEIISFIKDNNHLNDEELLKSLLKKTKKYGLGDTQIHKMIQKYRIN